MATQKPISTISYNTEAFLLDKLEAWFNAHIIQSFMYICHKGEDGDKDHIHLRIEPNRRVDPMDLSDELKEYVLGNSKPLGCRPWRPSLEEDWILYALHDKSYLKFKYGNDYESTGEKLPYELNDIKVSDGYDIEVAYVRAKSKMKHTTSNIANSLTNGKTALDLINEGENPFTVNAIARAVYSTDYERLSQAYYSLESDYNRLVEALKDKGFDICRDDNGKLYIE